MDATGPSESFIVIKDPHDQADQKQVSSIYYKTIYKSSRQQMFLKKGLGEQTGSAQY